LEENDIEEANESNNVHSSSKSFLSQSHHGSRRHLRSLAHNALCIVSEYGRPSIFITLTCNPFWVEIQEQLFEGQTAFDRPDITTRVFKARLTAFLHNLKQGKYFGNMHQVTYLINVIEYQKRGLPHAHIVLQFTNMPSFEDKIALSNWIDINISALLPELNPNSSLTDRTYCEYVTSHMVHKCKRGVCLDDNDICERGYTKNVIQQNTTFSNRGFPVYKRLNEQDLKIVPHNRSVLLDWNGHANVEFAGSTYLVIYLYKYLFKGSSKVHIALYFFQTYY
jgi:hypothetical protein